jgi:hypothetical protein
MRPARITARPTINTTVERECRSRCIGGSTDGAAPGAARAPGGLHGEPRRWRPTIEGQPDVVEPLPRRAAEFERRREATPRRGANHRFRTIVRGAARSCTRGGGGRSDPVASTERFGRSTPRLVSGALPEIDRVAGSNPEARRRIAGRCRCRWLGGVSRLTGCGACGGLGPNGYGDDDGDAYQGRFRTGDERAAPG